MPTGYTEAISKGISFEKFVMQCARAMGACVTMRDDSSDTEIPERFEPSDYYQKRLKETKETLKRLQKMSLTDAQKQANTEYKSEVVRHKKQIEESHKLNQKYVEMLFQVEQWRPPTQDHEGLKNFMVEQITSSITFDCNAEYYRDNPPQMLTGEKYLETHTARALSDIDYYEKENRKETARVNSRNIWIKQLRESLKGDT